MSRNYRRFRWDLRDLYNPSWRALNRHLTSLGIRKQSPLSIRETSKNDKGDEFKQEHTPRGVSKIPISRATAELLGMDFLGIGADRLSFAGEMLFRDSRLAFLRNYKDDRTKRGKVRDSAISIWVCVFCTSDILIADKDVLLRLRYSGVFVWVAI